jgi:hypothetical protein
VSVSFHYDEELFVQEKDVLLTRRMTVVFNRGYDEEK